MKPLALVAMLLAGALVDGCGYRLTAGGAPLPEGIRNVYAPLFLNHSGSNPINRLGETYRAASEPGVEAIFTQAFREQLLRAGVAAGPNAEAQIQGEILSIDSGPTILSITNTLATYRVSARLRLRLVKNGRQIVTTDVWGFEDFVPGREVLVQGGTVIQTVDGDVLRSETNRASAIKRLAETITRDAYDRLATGW